VDEPKRRWLVQRQTQVILILSAQCNLIPASIVPNCDRQHGNTRAAWPEPSTSSPQLNSIHNPIHSAPRFLLLGLNPSRFSMLHVVRRCFLPIITHSSFSNEYIRLESRSLHIIFVDPYPVSTVISAKNLKVSSERISAGIYISIMVDSRRRWKSLIRGLSSKESAVWCDTVTL